MLKIEINGFQFKMRERPKRFDPKRTMWVPCKKYSTDKNVTWYKLVKHVNHLRETYGLELEMFDVQRRFPGGHYCWPVVIYGTAKEKMLARLVFAP